MHFICFFILLFFYSFISYANDPCLFTANVSPIDRTTEVKTIYEDMCQWYNETFPNHPLDPEIPLNDVIFTNSWDNIDYVNNSKDKELSGLYGHAFKKEINEIVVLDPPQTTHWIKTSEWMQSVLAHEIFHYFTKSCCFDDLKKNQRLLKKAFIEASAYWAQDQFIKRNFNKSLPDLFANEEHRDITVSQNKVNELFVTRAFSLRLNNMPVYIPSALIWFNKNPQKRFEKVIKGQ